jgi:predicted nuclease of predicted toxin-antitoxin system
VRFLIDEMFGSEVVPQLKSEGHEASHVRELGLGAADDRDVLTRAAEDGYVVVTENAADFIPLLDARIATGLTLTPVVIALKTTLPRGGAMHHALVKRLCRWADENPDPYRHVHWLS